MTDKAYAYDPITGEDIEIRCHSKHRDLDRHGIDGGDLPVLIESDFDHDPVEGCQGCYTEICDIPDGCPKCGYDRKTVAYHTHAGVANEVCRACGTDLDWRAQRAKQSTDDTEDDR